MKNSDLLSGRIQLAYYGKEVGGREVTPDDVVKRRVPPVRLEPEVVFEKINGNDFQAERPFDIAYLAKSPAYTPPSSDGLLDVFRDYIRTEKETV